MATDTRDQYTFTNPAEMYAAFDPKKQHQPEPGLDAELEPKADLGEETYRGSGRLTGRKALITGADSGIGAATAIAFAREGADVAMSYLPEEEKDAQRIAGHHPGRRRHRRSRCRAICATRAIAATSSPAPSTGSADSTSW